MQDTCVPVYEALANDIKQRGVRAVFGLMSDDTALLVATLDAIGVRFFAARHETESVAMAEAYASATGVIGIAIAAPFILEDVEQHRAGSAQIAKSRTK